MSCADLTWLLILHGFVGAVLSCALLLLRAFVCALLSARFCLRGFVLRAFVTAPKLINDEKINERLNDWTNDMNIIFHFCYTCSICQVPLTFPLLFSEWSNLSTIRVNISMQCDSKLRMKIIFQGVEVLRLLFNVFRRNSFVSNRNVEQRIGFEQTPDAQIGWDL